MIDPNLIAAMITEDPDIFLEYDQQGYVISTDDPANSHDPTASIDPNRPITGWDDLDVSSEHGIEQKEPEKGNTVYPKATTQDVRRRPRFPRLPSPPIDQNVKNQATDQLSQIKQEADAYLPQQVADISDNLEQAVNQVRNMDTSHVSRATMVAPFERAAALSKMVANRANRMAQDLPRISAEAGKHIRPGGYYES